MNSNARLEIKYTPIFPIFMLLCSFVILWASLVAGPTPSSFVGIVLLLISVMMLTRPIVVVTPTNVEQRSLIGRIVHTRSFASEPPAIRDNALYCGGTKVLSQWLVNTKLGDIEQFLKNHNALPAK